MKKSADDRPEKLGSFSSSFSSSPIARPFCDRAQSFNFIPRAGSSSGSGTWRFSRSRVDLGSEVEIVRRVGGRIARISDKPGYEGEFTLIKEDVTANAFCLPGGKVAVYTGIFPVTQSEAGLAVVMAHEIAHAIARHGGERMTDQLAFQVGGMGPRPCAEKSRRGNCHGTTTA
jgi:hypothetical protein